MENAPNSSWGCKCEVKIVNRTIRSTSDGCELEAGPKHAGLTVEQLQMSNANVVATPGVDDTREIAKQGIPEGDKSDDEHQCGQHNNELEG